MADAVFLALSVLTVGSAIAALELRSLIYGSVALMGTLAGIAGFFLLLDSPFVALFQIAVYVGSIAVLILFTVMPQRQVRNQSVRSFEISSSLLARISAAVTDVASISAMAIRAGQ